MMTMDAKTVEEELTTRLISKLVAEDSLTMNALEVIKDTVTVFLGLAKITHIKGACSTISSYLIEHMDEHTVEEVLCVLYACSYPTCMVPKGFSQNTVAEMLNNSRDPATSVAFITATVLSYDGPLPSQDTWKYLIRSDKNTHELSYPPAITLQTMDTSKRPSKEDDWYLSQYRERIRALRHKVDSTQR